MEIPQPFSPTIATAYRAEPIHVAEASLCRHPERTRSVSRTFCSRGACAEHQKAPKAGSPTSLMYPFAGEVTSFKKTVLLFQKGTSGSNQIPPSAVSSAQLRFDYGNIGGLLANLLRDDTPIWVSLSPYYAYRRTPPFVTLSGAGKACGVEVLRRKGSYDQSRKTALPFCIAAWARHAF